MAAALARLAESEERFRMLAERTSDVIIRYDPSGMIEYASPAARAWGYAPHELIGATWPSSAIRKTKRACSRTATRHARRDVERSAAAVPVACRRTGDGPRATRRR